MAINAEVLEELDGRYLLFYINEMVYGVSLALVLEILQIQNITKMPQVAPHVKGIVNLRGKVVPVVDVRLKFNLPEKPYDNKSCIIVLELHDTHVGLIVDSVFEVATLEHSRLAAPPSSNSLSMQFLQSVAEYGEHTILNIDFDRFFQDDISINRI